MFQSVAQSGTSGMTTALGTYAGYKIGAKSDKKAFERQIWMMRNAHQLEVQDLRDAGLNPILSAGGGGAHPGTVSNTAASSAMNGASIGADLGKQLGALNLTEARERIEAIRATSARERATESEIRERTRAEYGDKKQVGNVEVYDKNTGKTISVPEFKREPGRVEVEKERVMLDNALRGVDAVKQKRLLEALKNNPKLLDSWIMLDALKDTSNSAGSVLNLMKGGK